MRRLLLLLFFLVCYRVSYSQEYRLSGKILDEKSGEALPFANIKVLNSEVGVVANTYGYYSIKLKGSKIGLQVSFVGYEAKYISLNVTQNLVLDILLSTETKHLDEIEIRSNVQPDLKNLMPGMSSISMDQVKNMPTLGGEADIFHSLQYLPGVRTAVEGTTGLSVRGGSFDQTLVTLDGAPVYNASHALGFYSTFNPDAIKSADIYKGTVPSQFGGRLSSVVDIKMREGNNRGLHVSGGIGLIASKLTVEGPITNERSSFIISGRYSYAGKTADLIGKTGQAIHLSAFNSFKSGNDIRFYDLNAKINLRSKNGRDHFFISGYAGKDWFQYYLFQGSTAMRWENNTFSFRWNRIQSQNLFSNTTAYFSRYAYNYSLLNDRRNFNWKAGLSEFGLKNEWDYFLSDNNTLKFGTSFTYTKYDPGAITPKTITSLTVPFSLETKNTLQLAAFIGLNKKITEKLSTYLGVRYSAFGLIGPGTTFVYSPDLTEILDSVRYEKKRVTSFNSGIEPRLALNYTLDSNIVFSLGYSRSMQYAHLLSNSSVGLPTDVWLPSNKNIPPQSASIFSLGYKQRWADYTLSLEAYTKRMQGVIDFIDNAELFVNQHIETQIRRGTGAAKGIEALLERTTGRLTGWITYTISKTDRTIASVNQGITYPTRYDRRHSFSLVSSYRLKKTITLSMDFQYNTGGAVSFPIGIYEFQNASFNYYSSRNGCRLPAYHRLDVQASFSRKKKRGERNWVIGVYNLYNQNNLFSAEVVPNDYFFTQTEIKGVSLYGITPSVGYNFKF